MKKTLFAVASVFLLLSAAGCSKTYFTGIGTQSHFDFPNSNVVPLGRGTGEASVTAFLGIPFVTAEMQEQAVNQAITSKGGDLLIDYMTFNTVTDLFIIRILTYRVEGTVAKMEVGTQKLH